MPAASSSWALAAAPTSHPSAAPHLPRPGGGGGSLTEVATDGILANIFRLGSTAHAGRAALTILYQRVCFA